MHRPAPSGPVHEEIPSGNQFPSKGRAYFPRRMGGHDFRVEMDRKEFGRSGCRGRFPGPPGPQVPAGGEVIRKRGIQYKKIAPFCKGNPFIPERRSRAGPPRSAGGRGVTEPIPRMVDSFVCMITTP